MDKLDLLILKKLMDAGRMSWKELATAARVSQPTVAERVRILLARKIIRGFRAIVDPDALGLHLTAYVFVTLKTPESREPFLKKILKIPNVIECHHTAGETDYLLKVRVQGTRALEQFISHDIKGMKFIARTQTTVVMETICETTALPVPSTMTVIEG